MKISELIKQLEYELKSTGDSEVYISIDPMNKHLLENHAGLLTCKNLVTSLDVLESGVCEFGIKNWML